MRVVRIALRFAALVAAVTLFSTLFAPAPAERSPYLSGLSDLAGSAALAAPTCQYKACPKEPGRKTPACHKTTQPLNCAPHTSIGCITSSC